VAFAIDIWEVTGDGDTTLTGIVKGTFGKERGDTRGGVDEVQAKGVLDVLKALTNAECCRREDDGGFVFVEQLMELASDI
jgi:hypothetical protein